MEVSKNAYYHWRKKDGPSMIPAPKEILKLKIKEAFENSRQIYGSCRIQKMLEREGMVYSRSYSPIDEGDGDKKYIEKEICCHNRLRPFAPDCGERFEQGFYGIGTGTEMGL